MEWYQTEDQKLIDATLDECIRQVMAVQREMRIASTAPCPYDDLFAAQQHLKRDIDILQPQSSVPF